MASKKEETLELLNTLSEFVTEANKSTSSLYKKEVLKKYPHLCTLFQYVYNEIKYKYGITSKNIIKLKEKLSSAASFDSFESRDIGLYDVLELLSSRQYTGHNAIRLVLSLISEFPQHEWLIYRIIDRNLQTRTNASLINDVYPDLIEVFNVALAEDFESLVENKINFEKDTWYCSRKLDGCRLIVLIDADGNVTLKSRQGEPFTTLDVIKREFERFKLKNLVFDGEVCLVDENGNENFKDIMTHIKRKNYEIPNPKYYLFDMIPYPDFKRETSNILLSQRYEFLKRILPSSNFITILPQFKINKEEEFNSLVEEARMNNWEGLILRWNGPYEGKRSKNMLKYKEFQDDEYVVVNAINGPIRWIDAFTNLEICEDMLSKVSIKHKGYNVDVGSGFTLDERKLYYKRPELIIGKTIKVRYFGESTDKNGNLSLRFPTLQHIYENGRDT